MVQADRFDDLSIKEASEVAKALGADLENGLASPEALRRLSENGSNELHAAPRVPAWRRFLAQFQDPMIYLLLAAGLIDGTHDLATARTAGFTTAVLAQLFNCSNARSETASAFVHLFVNPWLWRVIALSVLLQVAVVEIVFLNLAAGTVPLAFDRWLTCAAMTSAVLWFSELRKLISRASSRRDDATGSAPTDRLPAARSNLRRLWGVPLGQVA